MATDQVHSLATNTTSQAPVSLPGVGSITGAMSGGLNNILSTGGSIIDRFFPPSQREAMKSKLTKFATEKPYLASFLLSQIALSGLPLALFFIMTITVAVFALIAGVLVGVLGAVLFVVFAVGVALIVLLPTLFFTTFAAVAVWLWGMGAYWIVKKFNKKEVPGIHVPFSDGTKKQSGLAGLLSGATNGSANGEHKERVQKEVDVPPAPLKKDPEEHAEKKSKSQGVKDEKSMSSAANGLHTNLTQNISSISTPALPRHHADGKENQSPDDAGGQAQGQKQSQNGTQHQQQQSNANTKRHAKPPKLNSSTPSSSPHRQMKEAGGAVTAAGTKGLSDGAGMVKGLGF